MVKLFVKSLKIRYNSLIWQLQHTTETRKILSLREIKTNIKIESRQHEVYQYYDDYNNYNFD